jgi:ferredoxin--NADP+ reductase
MSDDLKNAVLSERIECTEALSIVRIAPVEGEVPPFEAGQFIFVGLPGVENEKGEPTLLKRAYSILTAPVERRYIELFVVHVRDGALTTQLWELKPGDKLWMDGVAKGVFTLEGISDDRNLVMVATGTGVGPYISMLRAFSDQGRWRRFVLIHGVRHVGDLGYADEIAAMTREDPTITYIPIVSRDPEFGGLQGRVQHVLEADTFEQATGFDFTPDTCNLFLCGNPEMVKSVREFADGLGFTMHSRRKPGTLHFEKYW